MTVDIQIAPAFVDLFKPARYKVWYGGRGGAKSRSFARALIAKAHTARHVILCTRQFQSSIRDSVHRVLSRDIEELGLSQWFDVQRTTIISKVTGSEFIFKGLFHNVSEIRSLEGATICWAEEGQSITEESWLILDPTIRAPGSEIWISMNPDQENDAIYQNLILDPPPDAIVRKVSWRDNPWFPTSLQKLRERMLEKDPDAYDWVWEGNLRHHAHASIFRGHFVVEPFETPVGIDRFYFGADWGFANDPTVLIRCFIQDETLYVDYEAYGIGVEIDDIPALFAGGKSSKTGAVYSGVPGARDWPIRGDAARPETISYLNRRGFNLTAARKWSGSVEDGIAHLKGFKRLVIHPRCENTAMELRLYSYKMDRRTDDVLPIVEDKWNHCLPAGTLITTERGKVPIEDVTTNDRVATRDGFHSITRAGVSGYNRQIFWVVAENGCAVPATAEHEIWTDRGFARVDELCCGDGLLMLEPSWRASEATATRIMQSVRRWCTAVLYSTAIRMQNVAAIESTSTRRASLVLDVCMWNYGPRHTVPLLPAGMYIIKTATRLITNSTIWNACRRNHTSRNIGLTSADGKVRSTGAKPEWLPPLGTLLMKVARGTANTLSHVTNRLRIKQLVSDAAPLMQTAPGSAPGGFAQTDAGLHFGARAVPTTSKLSAAIADAPIGAVDFGPVRVAPSRVLCVCAGPIADCVYDLTIEGQPEFFANDILVHNCVDSLRYALDGFISSRGGLAVWERLASSQGRPRRLGASVV